MGQGILARFSGRKTPVSDTEAVTVESADNYFHVSYENFASLCHAESTALRSISARPGQQFGG
jgi:hypothetical protein